MAARLFRRFARTREPPAASEPRAKPARPEPVREPGTKLARRADPEPVPQPGAKLAQRAHPEPAPQPGAKLAQRAHPERPSDAPGADDAELDALRGELVRELNRLAERSRSVD